MYQFLVSFTVCDFARLAARDSLANEPGSRSTPVGDRVA